MNKISDSILKFLGLEGLVQNLTGYVEARMELMKAEVREDMSRAVARGLVFVAMFLVAFLCLIFVSVGLAHLLGGLLESSYAGFFSVAGIYLATFLLLVVFRKNLHQYFERQLTDMIKRKDK